MKTSSLLIKYAVDKLIKAKNDDTWECFIRMSTPYENRYKKEIAKWFTEQGEMAINRLDPFNKAYNADDLIDFYLWHQQYEEFGQLMLWGNDLYVDMTGNIIPSDQVNIPKIGPIEAWGTAQLGTITNAISFDMKVPAVSEFINNWTFRFKNIDQETSSLLNASLKEGAELGEGIPQLTKRVRALFADMSKKRARMIARTEIIRAQNAGAEVGYQLAGIENKQWWTAKDERRCEFCAAMHGKIIPVGNNYFNLGDVFEITTGDSNKIRLNINYSEVKYPPLHPHCRCCLLPVVTLFD